MGIPLLAFLIFGMIWLTINLLAFRKLVIWSQHEYDRQMKRSNRPLTVRCVFCKCIIALLRFQLSENVRLGIVLLASLRAFCVGVAIALILVFLVIAVGF